MTVSILAVKLLFFVQLLKSQLNWKVKVISRDINRYFSTGRV